jgi:hypothetical protein
MNTKPKTKPSQKPKWVDAKRIKELLCIGTSTFKKYCSQNLFTTTNFEGKFLYDENPVIRMLNKNMKIGKLEMLF